VTSIRLGDEERQRIEAVAQAAGLALSDSSRTAALERTVMQTNVG
jgi:hypothetical protein